MSNSSTVPPVAADKDRARYTLQQFLEQVPPGAKAILTDDGLNRIDYAGGAAAYQVHLPVLELHCADPVCGDVRYFDPLKKLNTPADGIQDAILDFRCRHCTRSLKTFAVRFYLRLDGRAAQKFGEMPQFGPPLPARLLQLAGPDGEILKKGRQSENQGLGVGAFSYYRRVVELQKHKLIEAVSKAIERLGGDANAMETLETAKSESQFSKAIETIAGVTPKELYVGGRNPLTLLHGPLSVGIHTLTDEQCLATAHHIRVVLSAMLERVGAITEEKAELDAAIKELLKPLGSS